MVACQRTFDAAAARAGAARVAVAPRRGRAAAKSTSSAGEAPFHTLDLGFVRARYVNRPPSTVISDIPTSGSRRPAHVDGAGVLWPSGAFLA